MTHLSTLTLHRFRLGELDADAERGARTHLVDCPVCASRLGHQDRTRAAFASEPVPAALLPRPGLTGRLRGWWAALVVVPALAAALLYLGPLAERGDTRLKGESAALVAWIEVGDSARPVYTDERLAPGTRVQLRYDPGAHRYVTFAGRDVTGDVEVYGTIIARGPGLTAAPFALTLDDLPGEQVFYTVLTDHRPDPESVATALRSPRPVLPGAEVATVVLHKE